jgi:hypothetical protein
MLINPAANSQGLRQKGHLHFELEFYDVADAFYIRPESSEDFDFKIKKREEAEAEIRKFKMLMGMGVAVDPAKTLEAEKVLETHRLPKQVMKAHRKCFFFFFFFFSSLLWLCCVPTMC